MITGAFKVFSVQQAQSLNYLTIIITRQSFSNAEHGELERSKIDFILYKCL